MAEQNSTHEGRGQCRRLHKKLGIPYETEGSSRWEMETTGAFVSHNPKIQGPYQGGDDGQGLHIPASSQCFAELQRTQPHESSRPLLA